MYIWYWNKLSQAAYLLFLHLGFYLSAYTIRPACSSYEYFILRARRLSSKPLKQGYLVDRLQIVIHEVLWTIWGSYSAIRSLPLTNIKRLSDPWLVTVTSKPIRFSTNWSTFHLEYPWYFLDFTRLHKMNIESKTKQNKRMQCKLLRFRWLVGCFED